MFQESRALLSDNSNDRHCNDGEDSDVSDDECAPYKLLSDEDAWTPSAKTITVVPPPPPPKAHPTPMASLFDIACAGSRNDDDGEGDDELFFGSPTFIDFNQSDPFGVSAMMLPPPDAPPASGPRRPSGGRRQQSSILLGSPGMSPRPPQSPQHQHTLQPNSPAAQPIMFQPKSSTIISSAGLNFLMVDRRQQDRKSVNSSLLPTSPRQIGSEGRQLSISSFMSTQEISRSPQAKQSHQGGLLGASTTSRVSQQHSSSFVGDVSFISNNNNNADRPLVDDKVRSVREKALERQTEQRIQKEFKLMEASMRQVSAEERRILIGEQKSLERAGTWLVIGQLTRFALMCEDSVRNRTRRQDLSVRVQLWLHIRLRRVLRRCRGRLFERSAHCKLLRPTVPDLRQDKMFNAFSDAQLAKVSAALRIRYYFANETIIFNGLEEDEAYIVADGAVDVMMGPNKVWEFNKPGQAFGTPGMISGEPRTAAVVARTDHCFVWWIKKRTFDECTGRNTALRQQGKELELAFQLIASLRQANILQVYKKVVEPNFLRSFSTFHQLTDDTLHALITNRSSPKIVAAGETILHPAKGFLRNPHLLLLRGKVKISLQRCAWLKNQESLEGQHTTLENALRVLFDVPRKQVAVNARAQPSRNTSTCASSCYPPVEETAEGLTSTMLSALRGKGVHGVDALFACTSSGGINENMASGNDAVELLSLSAPALLNIGTLFSHEHHCAPFTVEATTDCDLLQLSRETLRQQDVLDLAAMQQNCLNLTCELMPVITKAHLVKLMMARAVEMGDDVMAQLFASIPTGENSSISSKGGRFPAHCTAESGSAPEDASTSLVPQKRWVFGPSEIVKFAPGEDLGLTCLVIVSGAIEPVLADDREQQQNSTDNTCGNNAREHEGAKAAPHIFPYLWPDPAVIYFGTAGKQDAVTFRTRTRVEAVLIKRADVLEWLATGLDDVPLAKLVIRLASNYLLHQGCFPAFSSFGLDCSNPEVHSGGNPKHGARLVRDAPPVSPTKPSSRSTGCRVVTFSSMPSPVTSAVTPAVAALQAANEKAFEMLSTRETPRNHKLPTSGEGAMGVEPSDGHSKSTEAKPSSEGGKTRGKEGTSNNAIMPSIRSGAVEDVSCLYSSAHRGLAPQSEPTHPSNVPELKGFRFVEFPSDAEVESPGGHLLNPFSMGHSGRSNRNSSMRSSMASSTDSRSTSRELSTSREHRSSTSVKGPKWVPPKPGHDTSSRPLFQHSTTGSSNTAHQHEQPPTLTATPPGHRSCDKRPRAPPFMSLSPQRSDPSPSTTSRRPGDAPRENLFITFGIAEPQIIVSPRPREHGETTTHNSQTSQTRSRTRSAPRSPLRAQQNNFRRVSFSRSDETPNASARQANRRTSIESDEVRMQQLLHLLKKAPDHGDGTTRLK